jgi:hypothetical protein
MNNNMKKTHLENGSIKISIGPCDLIVNYQQLNLLEEKLWYYSVNKFKYPYYNVTHGTLGIKQNMINYLYGEFLDFKFNDNNEFNLLPHNIITSQQRHFADKFIKLNYNILEYIQGHKSKSIIYNPRWLVENDNEKNYLIFCERDVLIKMTETNYNIFCKFNSESPVQRTWFYTNSKGEHILSRIKNMSTNLKSVILLFSIIKLPIEYSSFAENLKNVFKPSLYTNELILAENNNNSNKYQKLITLIDNTISLSKYEYQKKKYQFIENNIKENYKLIKKYKGHTRNIGFKAGVELNKIWKIKDENKIKYLMYCEPDILCILDKKAILKIKEFRKTNLNNDKITWNKMSNGYIQGSNNMYIHQVITGCYENGRGTMDLSVDHVDRDPLNNCFDNLRIATREEQESNTKSADGERRERKHNAKPLPEGITNDMMRKYVVYYKECYNKEKELYREFFKIEKHPKLEKPWIGSKSNKISIFDKLKEVNETVDTL